MYVLTRDSIHRIYSNACNGCLYSLNGFQCAILCSKDGALLFVILLERETTHYKYTILKFNDLRCAKNNHEKLNLFHFLRKKNNRNCSISFQLRNKLNDNNSFSIRKVSANIGLQQWI